MALSRIGIRQPYDAVSDGKHAFHEDGMHYELFVGDDGRLYVASDHEAVGLVTWFDAEPEDWSNLENEADEVIG